MRYLSLLSFGLLVFLSTWAAIPKAIAAEIPPPVEKVKPPVDKKKKAKKKIKLRKKKWQKQKKNQNEETGTAFVTILAIVSWLAVIVGAFIFGFGLMSTALITAGIALMASGNFIALIISFWILGKVEGIDLLMVFIPLILFALINFIIGLALLISGLIAMNPIAWIVGLVALGVFLLMALFMFLVIVIGQP